MLPSGRALGFLRPPSSISSKAKATLCTCRGQDRSRVSDSKVHAPHTRPCPHNPPFCVERTDSFTKPTRTQDGTLGRHTKGVHGDDSTIILSLARDLGFMEEPHSSPQPALLHTGLITSAPSEPEFTTWREMTGWKTEAEGRQVPCSAPEGAPLSTGWLHATWSDN